MPLFLAGEGALALPTPPAGMTVLPRDLTVAADVVRATLSHRATVPATPTTATSPRSADPAYGGSMLITHLGHACLLVEMADTRVLVDPGTFADDLGDVRDLAAVLVTHQHPDHLDPERLPALVAANPDAVVLCDPGSVEVLAGLGVEARAHDGATTVGAVTVTPFGEQHALIHDDIPRIANVGVRLDAEGEPSFFHPGDALDAEPGDGRRARLPAPGAVAAQPRHDGVPAPARGPARRAGARRAAPGARARPLPQPGRPAGVEGDPHPRPRRRGSDGVPRQSSAT